MRKLHTLVCIGIGLVFLGLGAVQAESATSAESSFRVSDARNVGANSVRFSAAQVSGDAPVVVLFGATTPNWHKTRAALRQVVAEGYPIAGVIMGPTDQPSTLEVYAKGHHVTNPIDLNQISQAEITRLVRDVSREYFAR